MSIELLKWTIEASLFVQASIGILDFIGLGIKVGPQHQILTDVLKIETFVQIIEFLVYVMIFNKFNIKTMAIDRYKNLFLTTHLMLFTTMIFMTYRRHIQENKNNLTLRQFISEHRTDLINIFLSNFVMLFFGLMGELGYMSLLSATFWGFLGYFYTFTYLYYNYARYSLNGLRLYWFFAIIWGIYGIVYLLPVIQKNIGYNILDIIAKNFFGLFLFILILKLRQ